MDPFVDLIRLLRPRATLWGGIEGRDRWGVSFRKRDDLLFCWLEKGGCFLIRPSAEPVYLSTGDFVLIRTVTPFTLASEPTAEPEESEALAEAANEPKLRVGSGERVDVVLHGGKFVFNTANEDLLSGLLPEMAHIAAGDMSSWRIRTLMKMNQTESQHPGPGREFIIGRLMELILVEILRSDAHRGKTDGTGLLAGLADPVTQRALVAMHGKVDQDWTVSSLAQRCGVSRSAFAARFSKVMGVGPMQYLLHWRVALAKDQLCYEPKSIGSIAFAVGFQSSSAFSTAFSRVTGMSPRAFAEAARGKI